MMMKDVIWQQFLLFCHRNGLYYGEQLDDTTSLCWSASGDEECKVIRSLHRNDYISSDSCGNGVEEKKDVRTGPRFMVVSSLERNLRN